MPDKILSDQRFGSQDLTTKNCLLKAITILVIKNGYAKTGTRDIAEFCNITASSVYTHFPSKEHIILEVFKQEITYCKTHLLDIANNQHLSPKEKIELFVYTLKKIFSEREESKLVYLLAPELYPLNTNYKEIIHAYMILWKDILHKLFKDTTKPTERNVNRTLCFLHGAIWLSHLFQNEHYLCQFFDEFFHSLILLLKKIHE